MLQQIKSFLFTPEADYVDYQDGLLVFRSKKLKPECNKIKLRMSFGTVAAHVVLQSFEQETGLYRAQLLNYEVVLEHLDDDRRSDVRLPRVFRVTSPDIPGYKGTTEDISVQGVRLTTEGALERELEISLKIELDDPHIPPMSFLADVKWTAKRLDAGFHSGLRFVGLERAQVRTLERYIEERLAAERRLHTLEGRF